MGLGGFDSIPTSESRFGTEEKKDILQSPILRALRAEIPVYGYLADYMAVLAVLGELVSGTEFPALGNFAGKIAIFRTAQAPLRHKPLENGAQLQDIEIPMQGIFPRLQ